VLCDFNYFRFKDLKRWMRCRRRGERVKRLSSRYERERVTGEVMS
jgi:hypothetical protein